MNFTIHNNTKWRVTFFVFVFVLFFLSASLFARIPFRVMFYNTNRFFMERNDYKYKIDNVAKVIKAVGGKGSSVLIGMCEVGGKQVVDDLKTHPSLRKAKYQCIVADSSKTGLYVALLYQGNRFKYICHECVPTSNDQERKKPRDVLYVTGKVTTGDTLDVFVCHFPSRRQKKGEAYRVYVASKIREKTDSLITIRKNANILIMGDFNDRPSDKSLVKLTEDGINIPSTKLYNLFSNKKDDGTYKYKKSWETLDQIIVSDNLRNQNNLFHVLPDKNGRITASVFREDFLFADDDKSTLNFNYSDHLPIFVDFAVK